MNTSGTGFYDTIRKRFAALLAENGIESEIVDIKAVKLSPEEAIGNPEDKDYPLITGKERIMQAEYKGCYGHAFTDMYGDFNGKLSDIVSMNLNNNYRKAIFVATLNAVMRQIGLISKSVHCKNEEPKECSSELVKFIEKEYGQPKIAFAGFQPRMIEALSKKFEMRVTDLDKNNIGTNKFGITIEDSGQTAENVVWADLLLVTGTTLVNGTIEEFLTGKPVVFYGVTISGVARLLNLKTFCHLGH